jgi:hypothetical protein
MPEISVVASIVKRLKFAKLDSPGVDFDNKVFGGLHDAYLPGITQPNEVKYFEIDTS